MKTVEVEVAVARMFGIARNLIVPNISWGLWIHECDLLIVTKSGYATEVEIKVSPSDLRKDFEKRHGHVDRQNRIKRFYYAVPDKLLAYALEMIPSDDAGVIAVHRIGEHGTRAVIEREAVVRDSIIGLGSADTAVVPR